MRITAIVTRKHILGEVEDVLKNNVTNLVTQEKKPKTGKSTNG